MRLTPKFSRFTYKYRLHLFRSQAKAGNILEEAARYGEVRVRRKDGQVFVIVPEKSAESPLNVEGIDLDLTREEIVEFVHEGRKYGS